MLRPTLLRALAAPLAARYNSTAAAGAGAAAANSTAAPAPFTLTHHRPTSTSPDSILHVSLCSPSNQNALSLSLVAGLTSLLTHTIPTTPSIRAFIISSALPKTFCAGADLKERRTFTPAQTTHFLSDLNTLMGLVETCPVPTVAAINGFALGGGLELALACDVRVVGPNALIGLTETRLGIIPGAGGTWRLPRLVGRGRALEMCLTARRVGMDEAVRVGIAERAADDPVQGALELAEECMKGAPIALRVLKETLGRGDEAEKEGYRKVVGTRDRDEALVAFREKRAPVWKGDNNIQHQPKSIPEETIGTDQMDDSG